MLTPSLDSIIIISQPAEFLNLFETVWIPAGSVFYSHEPKYSQPV